MGFLPAKGEPLDDGLGKISSFMKLEQQSFAGIINLGKGK